MSQLIVIFKEQEEFESAVNFFTNQSDFFAEDINYEFKSFSFPEENLDALEREIENELTENGFSSFHFESEI